MVGMIDSTKEFRYTQKQAQSELVDLVASLALCRLLWSLPTYVCAFVAEYPQLHASINLDTYRNNSVSMCLCLSQCLCVYV